MKLVKKEAEKETVKVPDKKKRLNQQAVPAGNLKPILLGGIGVILTVIICVIIAVEQLYEPTILTINEDKYQLSDVRYYIFTQEYQGYQYENMYQTYMQSSYWDQVTDEEAGETNLDKAKAQTLGNIIQAEVLYKEAVKNGYTITDEDRTNAETNLSQMKENLSSQMLRENGFSDSYLKKVLQKVEVVSRFQQDKIDSFDIDDEAIKAGIDYEDYHQYEIGVFKAEKTKKAEDSEEEAKPLPEEELKAAYDKLAALKDTVASSEELDKVLAEDEETITYTSEKIQADNTTYGKKNVKKIIKMDNGDVLDIFETEEAYYLVKMINNKATESYDNAVDSAISTEENTKFEEYFEDLKKEYTIKENKEEWDALDFGYITMNAYTGQ